MVLCIFFFKQNTVYEMLISDWSSDVCSSDLDILRHPLHAVAMQVCDVLVEAPGHEFRCRLIEDRRRDVTGSADPHDALAQRSWWILVIRVGTYEDRKSVV